MNTDIIFTGSIMTSEIIEGHKRATFYLNINSYLRINFNKYDVQDHFYVMESFRDFCTLRSFDLIASLTSVGMDKEDFVQWSLLTTSFILLSSEIIK